MSFMFGCQVEGRGRGDRVSLARRSGQYCVKGIDPVGGLSIQLGMGDIWLIESKDCKKRSLVGARILMCTRPLHFKDTKFEMLLHWGLHVSVRYKLNHLQAFEEKATREQIKKDIKVPALNCWKKGEPASGSVNSTLCAQATARGWVGTQRALLINFLLLLLKPPVGSRLLPISWHPYSLTENPWLCSG